MSDPRLTPDARLVTGSQAARISTPVVDLCRSAAGPRDRQLLLGDGITVLNAAAGWSYVQSEKDHYCGYVSSDSYATPENPTHYVSALATHAYAQADFKSRDRTGLSHLSRIAVTEQTSQFARTALGHIPAVHLSPIGTTSDDPAAIAALYLGTPYLWGGNSRLGLDCSGLVQAALLACGIPCPGDSDMQMALGQDADGTYRRNDLLFWKGHVALVRDATTLIHANAGAMAVAYEPIDQTITRIAHQGDGPVMAHRRLPALSGPKNSLPEA